jgi:hypothetical protein
MQVLVVPAVGKQRAHRQGGGVVQQSSAGEYTVPHELLRRRGRKREIGQCAIEAAVRGQAPQPNRVSSDDNVTLDMYSLLTNKNSELG